MIPKVMIILGSASDKAVAEKTTDILEKLEIPYSLKVASAHRTHELVKQLVIKGTEAGVEVFIGIAGLSAHLPGVISSYTFRPVIGVPVEGKLDGLDALYSIVQMPYPTPVASVGIDRGENAGILAGQILSINDSEIKERINILRKEYSNKVISSNEKDLDEFNGENHVKDFLQMEELDLDDSEYIDDSIEEDLEVGIIVGNHQDLAIAKKVEIVLERLKMTSNIRILCPIRFPKAFEQYVDSMPEVKLFIGVSSQSTQVTGALTSLTSKPVIGVPCSTALNINDSLFSMVSMPPGMPVGTVGIDNGKNAAFLAAEILALSNPEKINILKKVKSKKINV
ncbi:MAG: 5-(carboxyamino)imidazole ribonucleotide mutase [archaeon]|nr:5-(carboxyamino)imidazole ribonucleotide mutase [archaeon]